MPCFHVEGILSFVQGTPSSPDWTVNPSPSSSQHNPAHDLHLSASDLVRTCAELHLLASLSAFEEQIYLGSQLHRQPAPEVRTPGALSLNYRVHASEPWAGWTDWHTDAAMWHSPYSAKSNALFLSLVLANAIAAGELSRTKSRMDYARTGAIHGGGMRVSQLCGEVEGRDLQRRDAGSNF